MSSEISQPTLSDVRAHVANLSELLGQGFGPGLVSWASAYAKEMKWLSDYWNNIGRIKGQWAARLDSLKQAQLEAALAGDYAMAQKLGGDIGRLTICIKDLENGI